jgi:hypothetical protein
VSYKDLYISLSGLISFIYLLTEVNEMTDKTKLVFSINGRFIVYTATIVYEDSKTIKFIDKFGVEFVKDRKDLVSQTKEGE